MTYTYAILEVSRATYDEVARLLRKAEYHHCFDRDVIDMHGIALRVEGEDQNAKETGINRGQGAGLLRDGALRGSRAGAAAGDVGGEDACPEGGGEGQQEAGGGEQRGGGRGDAERGDDPAASDHDWTGGASGEAEGEAPDPPASRPVDWDGGWNDPGDRGEE